MDRGVKVAIFVASIVSLGLGLVWDQVLNQARTAVAQTASNDELGPEVMQGAIGSPDIRRLEVPEEFEVNDIPPVTPSAQAQPQEAGTSPQPEPAAAAGEWIEYTVQNGDSWWRIAHVHFRDRDLSSDDVERANPGVRLRPGAKVKIPPHKDAVAASPRPSNSANLSQQTATPGATGYSEHTVIEGDSWWRLAHVTYRDRGLKSQQLQDANPNVNLRPGVKIRIPAGS